MTDEQFSEQITGIIQNLYRVSYGQLSQSCDRDDAVQECLFKAWQKRHQIKNEQYLQTWIIRILINECHNIHKKHKRDTHVKDLPLRIAPEDSNAQLHDALFQLEEKLRLPIILYYMEGYQTNEIAKILRLPQGTVKTRMLRGRRVLKEILNEEVL